MSWLPLDPVSSHSWLGRGLGGTGASNTSLGLGGHSTRENIGWVSQIRAGHSPRRTGWRLAALALSLTQNHSILLFTPWTLWREEEEFVWGLGFCCYCWPEWWSWIGPQGKAVPTLLMSMGSLPCVQRLPFQLYSVGLQPWRPPTVPWPCPRDCCPSSQVGLVSHSLCSSNSRECKWRCPEATVVGWTYSGPTWMWLQACQRKGSWNQTLQTSSQFIRLEIRSVNIWLDVHGSEWVLLRLLFTVQE